MRETIQKAEPKTPQDGALSPARREVIQRTRDAGLVNSLVNHPEIRPFIGGDVTQPVDLSQQVEVEQNKFLLGEHGGFSGIWCAPDVYEIHTFILKSGRGSWALAAAREGIRIMRDEYGARQLWTRVADGRDNVIAFTKASGMTEAGKACWDIGSGPMLFHIFEWRD